MVGLVEREHNPGHPIRFDITEPHCPDLCVLYTIFNTIPDCGIGPGVLVCHAGGVDFHFVVCVLVLIFLRVQDISIGLYYKAPSGAFPGTIGVCVIDFVDAPEVLSAPIENFYKSIGSVNLTSANEQRTVRVGLVNIIKVGTEVNIVFYSKCSRIPTQLRLPIYKIIAVTRIRIAGLS